MMGKLRVSLTDTNETAPPLVMPTRQAAAQQPTQSETPRTEDVLASLSLGLPSPSQAKRDQMKHAPRLNWSFTNVPAPIKAAFEDEAKRRGMTLKGFFYHCLRAGGLDIPDYETIDARRR